MRAAQKRAQSVGLRMNYRRHQHGKWTDWDLVVDGNGYAIAAWSQQLRRELPIVAEGYSGLERGPVARNVASSLVSRWTDWCVGESNNTTISSTKRDDGLFYWPVIDVPKSPHSLEPRLTISDDVLGRWIVGELPIEVAIEELHTAVEGVLRAFPGARKRSNWPQLLVNVESLELLTPSNKELLTEFNCLYRNRLKHRTLALTDSERVKARDDFHKILGVAEKLLGRMPS